MQSRILTASPLLLALLAQGPWVCALLPVAELCLAVPAEAAPRIELAQAATLQVPQHPAREAPVGTPQAAPRQPVQQGGAVPVVPAHGPLHPRKPPRRVRSAHTGTTEHPASAAAAGVAAGAAGVAAAHPPGSAVPPGAGAGAPAATTASGAASAAAASGATPEEKGAVTKLPDPESPEGAPVKLPRFASFRSDDVNMRVGPGARYKIDWVYKRRDLPVEIERQFDVWRWIRDPDGTHGWVHQATLMGRRSFIVQNANATLRSDAADSAAAVAVLQPGVIGRIRSCEATSDWCNVQAGSYRGYLRREEFWGVLPNEAITP